MGCIGAAAVEVCPPPTPRCIAKWQVIRQYEKDPERFAVLVAHAMSADEFKRARKRKHKRLTPIHFDDLDELRAPAGAVRLLGLVAAAAAYHERPNGLHVAAQLLAAHVGCSRNQVPIAAAWLARRHLLEPLEIVEPHPEGFRARRGGRRRTLKHAQVANVYMPGPKLLELLEQREARISGRRRALFVAVQGSQNLRSDAFLSSTKTKKTPSLQTRETATPVDSLPSLAVLDQIARAEEAEAKERARRRARSRSEKSNRGLMRERAAPVPPVARESRTVAHSSPAEARTASRPHRPTLLSSSSPEPSAAPESSAVARACISFLVDLTSDRLTSEQLADRRGALERLAREFPAEAPSPSRLPRRSAEPENRRAHPSPSRSSRSVRPTPPVTGYIDKYAGCQSDDDERERERQLRRERRRAEPDEVGAIGAPIKLRDVLAQLPPPDEV
jgi:hypothetical protein